MKKNSTASGRILGRRLAQEITRKELAEMAGAAASASDERSSVSTWTMTYPADGPYADGGGGGPIYT
jgi:hypothetical protein